MLEALALSALPLLASSAAWGGEPAPLAPPATAPPATAPPVDGGAAVESPGSLQDEGRGNRRSPKISMPHDLPETLEFERTWSRRRVDFDFLMADAEHTGPLTLTVKELDDKGIRTVVWATERPAWTRTLNEGELVDRAADQGVAELRTGIEYDLLISPKYRTLLLEDPEAARVTADAAVARAVATIEEAQYFYAIKERAKAIVRSAFVTPELLEYTLLDEPTILMQPLGRSFRMGEDRRWEDFFVNPIGAAPLPAMSILVPTVHDEEAQQIEVRWTRELDYEQAKPLLEDGLETIRRRLRDNEDMPEASELFEIREEVRYLLDLQTGLPLFAERRAYVRIDKDERVESVRFVRKGFEAPESLTGPWDTVPVVEPAEGGDEDGR